MLWEAQFGDFVNGAQVIIDQFIVAPEAKWRRLQRPHPAAAARLRGPGPGALQRAAGALPAARAPRTTSRSCNPTTPAQYFHLLRRQALRPCRKPLVVMTPKSLLRHPRRPSPLDELTAGTLPGGHRRSAAGGAAEA